MQPDHILHHLLALYALGATPTQLEAAYHLASGSQRPTRKPDADRVLKFADPAMFKLCLGKGRYYDDYLSFFQREISIKGVPVTVNEFLFTGEPMAEDMLCRFFSGKMAVQGSRTSLADRVGFLHSPIHLGYAIEFSQPLVVAEALALTAIHDSSFGEILKLVEQDGHVSHSKGLLELQQEIITNRKLRRVMEYKHGVFQVRDGLLANARDDFLRVMGSWKVAPDELKKKTAECLSATSK